MLKRSEYFVSRNNAKTKEGATKATSACIRAIATRESINPNFNII